MTVLALDVNETLLDLRPLDAMFANIFGDASVRREWFDLLLQRAFTASMSGAYRDFSVLARSALQMVALKHATKLREDTMLEVLESVKHLPAHPEVSAALQTLNEGGFTLVALSQSPLATLEAQMINSGLKIHFARLFSADVVKRYKPDPATYHMVAREMSCSPSDVRLIAAHGWDIEGAMRAGCKAAFIARPGQVLDPNVPEPDIIGTDLSEVALKLQRAADALKL